jgi:hypothetical protein
MLEKPGHDRDHNAAADQVMGARHIRREAVVVRHSLKPGGLGL